jgi:hypothetical protein
MLPVSRSGPLTAALLAIAMGCGGRVAGDGDAAPSGFPEAELAPEKTPKSGKLETPGKVSTAGRIDTSFAGTGSASISNMGALPVCLVVGARGQIWAAGRKADVDSSAPRELVQLDPRGSLDERVAAVPFETRKGFLAKLVGLESCSRTDDGALVVVHRGGQLGSVDLPVGPGLAYVSRLVATSPAITFETVSLPFPALLVETDPQGTYTVAADKTDGISELTIARVTRGGLVLEPVSTPALRHFRVRRLLRDGDTTLVAGIVDGTNAYPNVMVGRLAAGAIAWTYPGLADMETSLASRDRFGLALDDEGQPYVAVGPDLTVARFTAKSSPLVLDPDFGVGGTVRHGGQGFAWDAVGVAGQRVVVATSSGLVRVTSEGSLDTTYGDFGRAKIPSLTDRPLRVTSTTDGAVLVAGVSRTNTLEITRFTP